MRTAAYSAAGSALWALLPVIGQQRLGLGAAGFGGLMACLGTGAVAAGLTIGPLRQRLGLERLVAEGVLERREYQNNPPRFEYRLTEKGRDLYPVILLLKQWGDRWMVGPEGPPALHRHRNCGHITTAVLVCSECQETLTPFDMQVEQGPGMPDTPPEHK